MECMRTCLVCRKTGDRKQLLRFVRALDGEIRFDDKGVIASRGAWVCANRPCLVRGFEKRLVFRTEKTLRIDAEEMISQVVSRIKKNTLSRLGLLKRSGQIECGKDTVARAIALEKTEAVVFANDFARRSMEDVRSTIKRNGGGVVEVCAPFSMEDFGKCLGRRETGVVALFKSRITSDVLLHLNMLSKI